MGGKGRYYFKDLSIAHHSSSKNSFGRCLAVLPMKHGLLTCSLPMQLGLAYVCKCVHLQQPLVFGALLAFDYSGDFS